jgi:hypothetical protein
VAVRSRRLFGPTLALALNAGTALYTVPPGRTAIIHTLWMPNFGGNSLVTITVPSFDQNHEIWQGIVPSQGTTVFANKIILNPGDTLWGSAVGAVPSILFTGFGSLLLGAPS